jgi:hypothetical protein
VKTFNAEKGPEWLWGNSPTTIGDLKLKNLRIKKNDLTTARQFKHQKRRFNQNMWAFIQQK